MMMHPHVSHALTNQHTNELEHAAAAARLAHTAQRASGLRRHAPASADQIRHRTPLARPTHRRQHTALA